MAAVHSALAAYPGEWLLIFDNARGQAPVQRFLPPAGNGRVLITSQSAAWPRGQAVQVPPLGIEVAAVFLVNRTGDPASQAAAALADELGGLPLALEQAAAYIQATGTTLTGYLSVFRDREADLLARGEAAGHPADVAATLGLALSRLEDGGPARGGAAAAAGVPGPRAGAPGPAARRCADRWRACPGRRGLGSGRCWVTRSRPGMRSPRCAATRWSPRPGMAWCWCTAWSRPSPSAQLPAEVAGQWEQAAAALVEAAIPADTRPARGVAGVRGAAAARPRCPGPDQRRHVADRAATSAISGSYPAARDLLQLIADAHSEDDAYGAEHPDTLAARAELARCTGKAGDAAGARDQFAALLPVYERVLGPEHPDTLAARSNLARWTGKAGDAAGARDQFAALLPVDERVLGAEHQDTLTTRRNLARWTGVAGDAAAARDQLAALLPVDERVLGAEHHDTLYTRGNLARWTGMAGDAAAARDQLAALLPVEGAGTRPRAPIHPVRPGQPRPLDRAGGGCGRRARPIRRAAAHPRTSPRRRAPGHPDDPRRPRLLDQGSGQRSWTR